MPARARVIIAAAAAVMIFCVCGTLLQASEVVSHPLLGVTHITRTETAPRSLRIHVVLIDLTIPGIRFEMTPPGGSLETTRRTTLGFLNEEHAQVAINGHFFLPFPSANPDAMLIGLAAFNGNVYSAFESPVQSYAIVTDVEIDLTR